MTEITKRYFPPEIEQGENAKECLKFTQGDVWRFHAPEIEGATEGKRRAAYKAFEEEMEAADNILRENLAGVVESNVAAAVLDYFSKCTLDLIMNDGQLQLRADLNDGTAWVDANIQSPLGECLAEWTDRGVIRCEDDPDDASREAASEAIKALDALIESATRQRGRLVEAIAASKGHGQ